eukprot:gene29755-biopygen4378
MLLSLNRKLLRSSRDGDVHEVVSLLVQGANVNCKDSETPLHWAAQKGHVQCVRALLARGAVVDPKTVSGSTPLHKAAWRGHVECIKALLDNGADINSQCHDGWTPLHCAAGNGNIRGIQALLVNGAELDTQDKFGNSPLHYAALDGRVECIKALLESGALVTIKNARGQSALDKAMQEGHQDGADVIRSHSRRRPDVDQRDGDQQPDQNSSGHLQTENEELRTQLAAARLRIDDYAAQLTESRAQNDAFEMRLACMTGQQDVIASQDLETLEPLLAKVDLGCLMKAVLEKRVQREVYEALQAASECSVCLSAPKDTGLDPCGHTICRSCSDLVQVCPTCRKPISDRRRVFL